MILQETYIVCNSGLSLKLRSIKEFKLNLGTSLINEQHQFLPSDVKIQKHYMRHGQIINLLGYIGTLKIYSLPSNIDLNTLIIYNEEDTLNYQLDSNMSLYDNINEALDIFFSKFDKNYDVNTKVEEETKVKEEVYIKPQKKLSEMTEAERIAYARNIK